jgi:hypothetical protein
MRIVQNAVAGARPSRAAITLLEMLVSVSLLLLIILGLYGMFEQVQKAFRQGTTQVDVLEGVRSTLNLIKSDFDQVTISPNPYGTNLYLNDLAQPAGLVMGNLDGRTQTNYFDSFYLLTYNSGWYGVGYRIGDATNPTNPPVGGIGTLYRYQTANNPRFTVDNNNFVSNPSGPFVIPIFTNLFQRVLDGVVHLRIRAAWQTNQFVNGVATNFPIIVPFLGSQYTFTGPNLPRNATLELGIVEAPLAAQAQALPAASSLKFLTSSNNAERVHFFQIPLTLRPGS